jgi:hypothetical protein
MNDVEKLARLIHETWRERFRARMTDRNAWRDLSFDDLPEVSREDYRNAARVALNFAMRPDVPFVR